MKINMPLRFRCITVLLLLALPVVTQAQFTFTTNNGAITITGYTGPGGAVVIPNTTNGYTVTGIGDFAFENSTNLTSVAIPNSVTNIGGSAFQNCASLENVFIGSGVTNIGALAFAYCGNLMSAYFSSNAPPDVGNAFYGDPATTVYYLIGTTGWGPTFGGSPTVGETPASEFDYSINDNFITITGYTGPRGQVIMPGAINGIPVTGIGDFAFENSTNLTSVTIPSSITTIGYKAFWNCGGLTNVTFANGVPGIGEDAFFYCANLTSVTIPDSVTNIGVGAFQGCASLPSVTIPASVSSIGVNAFLDCTAVTNFSVDAANQFYSSLNGALLDKAQDTLVYYPAGLTRGSYTIPNSVTSIAYGAFASCNSLTNIIIPGSVTSVAAVAFQYCSGLASVYFEGNAPPDSGSSFLGDSNTVYYLPGSTGWGATFGGASTEFWFQSQPAVLSFEPSFRGQNRQFGFLISWATNASVIVQACTNLANPLWIPVATNAMSNGTNYFSDSQWTNYPRRFYRVSSGLPFVPFIFTTNNGAITITSYTGQGGAVLIPNTINGYAVVGIGENAFARTEVTSVTIPNSVTNIGPDAFANCTSLTSILIANSVIGIGTDAFLGCNSLTSVVIPESVTSIGVEIFLGCASLTSVTIPKSVTSIGMDAFLDCTSLASITIPNSVTNIGVEVFLGCTSLTNISVNGSGPYSSINGVLFGTAPRTGYTTIVAYPEGLTNSTYTTLGDSYQVNGIGQEAFSECESLTSIFVTPPSIGNLAFYGCTGLTSVTVSNQYGSSTAFNVGTEAFESCSSLTNVTFGDFVTVTNIGAFAFANCVKLKAAYIAGNAPPDLGNAFYGDPDAVVYYVPGTTGWGPTFGGAPTVEGSTPADEFEYQIYNGSVNIQQYYGYYGSSGVVVIPSTINGYPVTSIEGWGNTKVTSVTIPNTVTSIGGSTFENCTSLTNVTIGNRVTSIGMDAFESCTSLTSITIPNSVTSIGQDAFESCTSLKFVYFQGNAPANVANPLNQDVFYDDPAAIVYYLPWTSGWGATFSGAPTESDLNYVTNNGSITITGYVGPGALETLVIPNAINGYEVTSIGAGAFAYYNNLAEITIPKSVTNIGAFAFELCPNLTSAYFQGNAPINGGNVFYGNLATVYYLPGTTGWGAVFGGAPTAPWYLPGPTVLNFEPSFGVHNQQFGFSVSWATNASVIVQGCTNLSNAGWVPVTTNSLSNGTYYFIDSQWTNYPCRFYRVSGP